VFSANDRGSRPVERASGASGRNPTSAPLEHYTSLPYITSTYTFVETKQFSRLVGEYLSDDDYASLQRALIANPAAGALIPGTGGVRKIRWAAAGRVSAAA
jgi:hypothetical protein